MGLKRWREGLLASRKKFVWQVGLAWGVMTGVIVAGWFWYIYWLDQESWIAGLKAMGVVLAFVAVGPLWGRVMWRAMQKQPERKTAGIQPNEDQALALALGGTELSDEAFCREHDITAEKLDDIRQRRIVIVAGYVAQMEAARKANPTAFKTTGPTIEIRGEQHDKACVEGGIEYCLPQTWRQATWQPSDTVVCKPNELVRPYEGKGYDPDKSEFVRGGWDHDHCELCWWTLDGRDGPAHNTGWVSDTDVWLCNECYARFIQPRLEG